MRGMATALAIAIAMSYPLRADEKAAQSGEIKGARAVQAFELPPSSFLTTAESRDAFLEWMKLTRAASCDFQLDTVEKAAQSRPCIEKFFATFEARQRARYPVHVRPATIAGVYTEIITPAAGVSSQNQQRVLINLHGGAFNHGARYMGRIESIPIAAVGKFTVVSVDYRMGPEHRFPAASEDAAAVYRKLLEKYEPGNIGIYGCSAGGVLTAQAVAWFDKQRLPRPGAVGMFCAAGAYWSEGDSGHLAVAIAGVPADSAQHRAAFSVQANAYFNGADPNDPLVFPVRSAEVLAKFPPSLLISSTRDLALSSVVHTHSQLAKLGVPAELHVWEGMDHGFLIDPDLPEAREAYDVVVRFFAAHLGRDVPRSKQENPLPPQK